MDGGGAEVRPPAGGQQLMWFESPIRATGGKFKLYYQLDKMQESGEEGGAGLKSGQPSNIKPWSQTPSYNPIFKTELNISGQVLGTTLSG